MSTVFLLELGQKMKRWRTLQKIPQDLTAQLVGIDQCTWSKYERGSIIGGNAETVERIKRLIGWY